MTSLSAALDLYFEDLERQDLYSGVTLITQGAQRLYAGAYGYASRPWRIQNSLDVRFDTASVTKLFTAVATLQLIDQGLLSFDTRVISSLGIEGTTIAPEVTVYQLLSHTSGIGDDCEEEAGEVYEDLWKTKANYSVTTTADILPQFTHKPANFPPGQGCCYCNCSFILLGLLIEKISGLPYREYVRKNIFQQAGMLHSDFFRLDRVTEQAAEGCDPLRDEAGQLIEWKKNIYSFPPIGSPDSGAYVTASDLDLFLRRAQAGVLLSPQLTQMFFSPQVDYHESDNWKVMFGFVLEYYLDKSGKLIFYQKDGVNGGVSAIIRHYPEQDINVVLLSNMQEGVWEPIWKIHELLTENDPRQPSS